MQQLYKNEIQTVIIIIMKVTHEHLFSLTRGRAPNFIVYNVTILYTSSYLWNADQPYYHHHQRRHFKLH